MHSKKGMCSHSKNGIPFLEHNFWELLYVLLKEVFQPHLPVRLPCYDFTPVTSPALGVPLQTVGVTTLGIASSRGVTGGVYKARERIHRSMADLRLLAIPTSCRRVAACNPN
jgi:hypothetical protein